MARRARLYVCGTDGDPTTVLAEISPEVRAARQAYMREYFGRFRDVKRDGAVENDSWPMGEDLRVERPPWYAFDTRGRPTGELPVADLGGDPVD